MASIRGVAAERTLTLLSTRTPSSGSEMNVEGHWAEDVDGIFLRVVLAYVLSQVALLLGGVGAVRAFELRLLATLHAQVVEHVLAPAVHLGALWARGWLLTPATALSAQAQAGIGYWRCLFWICVLRLLFCLAL